MAEDDAAGPALAARLEHLRELLDQSKYPEAIPALVRHLQHRHTPEETGATLAEAAWLLTYALDRVVSDATAPWRWPLRTSARPAPRAPHCRECADEARED